MMKGPSNLTPEWGNHEWDLQLENYLFHQASGHVSNTINKQKLSTKYKNKQNLTEEPNGLKFINRVNIPTKN